MSDGESQARAFFHDVYCKTCGKPASLHGLHAATHVKGECVWTWIGVVRDEIDAGRARSASETRPGGATQAERKATAVLVSECNSRTVNESERNA